MFRVVAVTKPFSLLIFTPAVLASARKDRAATSGASSACGEYGIAYASAPSCPTFTFPFPLETEVTFGSGAGATEGAGAFVGTAAALAAALSAVAWIASASGSDWIAFSALALPIAVLSSFAIWGDGMFCAPPTSWSMSGDAFTSDAAS